MVTYGTKSVKNLGGMLQLLARGKGEEETGSTSSLCPQSILFRGRYRPFPLTLPRKIEIQQTQVCLFPKTK